MFVLLPSNLAGFQFRFCFVIYSGLSVGIYTTNSADAVAYVLQSSGSNVCVVENDAQLKKVLQVWDELPDLKAVVQYSGKPDTDKENVYTVCILDSFNRKRARNRRKNSFGNCLLVGKSPSSCR